MNALPRFLRIAVVVHALVASVAAQPPPGRGKRGSEPQASTVINADRTVTFSVKAPEATSVAVHLQTPPQNTLLALQKNEAGGWSGTTPAPLAPDIYFYHFVVGGLTVNDPTARRLKGQGARWGSILEVKGDTPQDFEFQPDIAHGAVAHEWIHSKVLGETRGLHVYTPPSHATSAKSYPVLYLLHGAGGDERTWIGAGYIDRLADSWIARRAIDEAIIVVTSNRVGGAPTAANNALLRDYFTKEIMPHVEGRYRVKKGRENTAVAGFSMGGRQTLTLALGLPERFGALACLSGALGRGEGTIADQFPILKDAAKVNRLFPVLHVACGESDPLLNAAKKFHEELSATGIRHTFTTGPGDHSMKADWKMLQAFLRDFTLPQ